MTKCSEIDQDKFEINPEFKHYKTVFDNLIKGTRIDTEWVVVNC